MTENNPSLTHDLLADSFDNLMNQFDISRRLSVLIGGFLSRIHQSGLKVLDAGCGTGIASQSLGNLGHDVTSIDLGFNLLKLTQEKAGTDTAQASILQLPFSARSFDIVFSTEVIEHVPDPLKAVTELWRVIKPGGWLALSTPNRLWQFPVRLASALRIRPYDGYENFLRPAALRKHILQLGGAVLEHRGIHLLPFQVKGFHRLNIFFDNYGKALLPIMINQAIFCQKR